MPRRPEVTSQQASDPNTSPETLAWCLLSYPDLVFQNPAIALLALEQNRWLAPLAKTRLLSVLDHTDVPPAILLACQVHPEPLVVEVARLHANSAPLEPFWEGEIRRFVFRETPIMGLPPLIWMQRWGFEDLLPEGLIPPRSLTRCPDWNREELHRQLYGMTQSKTAEFIHYCSEYQTLEFLIEHYPRYNEFICRNPLCPADLLLKMYRKDPTTAKVILYSPNCPEVVIRDSFGKAKEVSIEAIKAELAARHQKIWDYQDEHSWKIYEYRWMPRWFRIRHLIPHRLRSETPDTNPLHLLLHAAVDHPSVIAEGARSPWWQVRFGVAINPNAGPKPLHKLANDPNRYVRAAARARLSDPAWRFRYREPEDSIRV
jgi:hypothetical protein